MRSNVPSIPASVSIHAQYAHVNTRITRIGSARSTTRPLNPGRSAARSVKPLRRPPEHQYRRQNPAARFAADRRISSTANADKKSTAPPPDRAHLSPRARAPSCASAVPVADLVGSNPSLSRPSGLPEFSTCRQHSDNAWLTTSCFRIDDPMQAARSHNDAQSTRPMSSSRARSPSIDIQHADLPTPRLPTTRRTALRPLEEFHHMARTTVIVPPVCMACHSGLDTTTHSARLLEQHCLY